MIHDLHLMNLYVERLECAVPSTQEEQSEILVIKYDTRKKPTHFN